MGFEDEGLKWENGSGLKVENTTEYSFVVRALSERISVSKVVKCLKIEDALQSKGY